MFDMDHEATEPRGGRMRPSFPVPGDFLIAAAGTHGEYFDQSVLVILDADENGTLGVVLNRFASVELTEVLPGWREMTSAPHTLFSGGPVTPDGALCLAHLDAGCDEPLGWRRIFGEVGLLLLDTPVELVENRYSALRIFAGYSGWSAGQLEDELSAGLWYLVRGDSRDVFTARPEDLWRSFLRRSRGEIALFSTWTPNASMN